MKENYTPLIHIFQLKIKVKGHMQKNTYTKSTKKLFIVGY